MALHDNSSMIVSDVYVVNEVLKVMNEMFFNHLEDFCCAVKANRLTNIELFSICLRDGWRTWRASSLQWNLRVCVAGTWFAWRTSQRQSKPPKENQFSPSNIKSLPKGHEFVGLNCVQPPSGAPSFFLCYLSLFSTLSFITHFATSLLYIIPYPLWVLYTPRRLFLG